MISIEQETEVDGFSFQTKSELALSNQETEVEWPCFQIIEGHLHASNNRNTSLYSREAVIENRDGDRWTIRGTPGRNQPVFVDHSLDTWTVWQKGFQVMIGISDIENPEYAYFVCRKNQHIRLSDRMSIPTDNDFESVNDPRIFFYHTSPLDDPSKYITVYRERSGSEELLYVVTRRTSNNQILTLGNQAHYWNIRP